MARRRESDEGRTRRRDASGGFIGKVFAGVSLLAVGVCLGIILGSILDGPRLFVRRLTEPIQRVDVGRFSTQTQTEPLAASPDLQPERRAMPRPVTSPPGVPIPVKEFAPPSPGTSRPETKLAPVAAREPQPAVPVPAPRTEPPEQVAAERVIAEIRAQAEKKKGSGKVCQVAAYKDQRSARALANRLMEDGFDSYVSHTYHKEQDRYRVRVRPKADSTIESVASHLKRKGLSVWVTDE